MKLILPDYDFVFEDGSAEVKDGKLYIYKLNSFKDIMYRLTYMVYGSDECYFCHKKLRTNMLQLDNSKYFSKITLDHLIPQDFGGPTITNNLRPACSECNSSKRNMYPDEFEEYKEFMSDAEKHTKEEKDEFKKNLELKKEQRRLGEIESIDETWFSNMGLRDIYGSFNISEPLGVRYRKQEKFFKNYKRLQKPLVISQNKFLLDGFISILIGKYYFCNKNIKIIVLENVYFKGLY